MSIFGIIAITGLMATLVFCIGGLASDTATWSYSDKGMTIAAVIAVAVWIIGILVGIGLVTEDERIYVAKYEMQKTTIEESLESDTLTGLERIELVNKAIELNGELAERKARFDLWHTVHYDNSIYDDVDFISFKNK